MADRTLQILPNVFLITGPDPLSTGVPDYRGCCVYLIINPGKKHVLIDTGYGHFYEPIVKKLAERKVAPEDIGWVICTHIHGDHAGGCALFQEKGAKIAAHYQAGEWIDFIPRFGNGRVPNDLPFRVPHHLQKPFRPDIFFEDGQTLEADGTSLKVVYTPGHTQDSACFLATINGKKVLFSGDLTGWFIFPWGSNYEQMLQSVRKAQALGADMVLGGHAVVMENTGDYWDRLLRSLEDGIFSLVDRFQSGEHCKAGTKKLLGQ